MSALREIIAAFRIGVDHKEVKEGENAIASFKEKLVSFGESLAAAFAVERLHAFIEGQIEAGAELKKTSEKIGVETDELQALQLAANQAGVSSESLATGLRFLNRNISEAAGKGGEHAALFKKLGVSIKDASGHARPAGDVMQDLADSIASMDDPARQTEVAMKLLGRGGVELLPVLKQGGQAFDDARKQMQALGGGMSKEFVEQAHQAERANVQFKFALTGLKSEIAGALLPTFQKMIQVGINVAMNLRQMAKEPGVIRGALLALAAAGALAAPVITAIAVGGGILYLAIDELYGLLKGNDSLIGDALGPDKKKFVDDLRAAIQLLTGSVGEDSDEIGRATGSWSGFKDVIVAIDKVLASIVEALAWIVDKADLLGDLFASMSSDKGKADAGWAMLKARLKDEGTGRHENVAAYVKQRRAEQAAQQKENDRPADEETERRDWMTAVRNRDEWEAHNKERVAGGQKPEEMQPELKAFFNEHANPFPTIAGPGASGGQNIVAVPVPPPAGGSGGVTIQQNNTFDTTVTGADVSDPNAIKTAVGNAQGPAVATAAERGTARAYTNGARP